MTRPLRVFSIAISLGIVLGANGLAAAQTADPIAAIRQHYSDINRKVPTYKKVKKNLSGYSAEGGTLVAYFHGPSIMKMTAVYFGETGRASEEYYYWNGKLIFVFHKEERYDKPLSGKVVSTKENRFYFANDNLIKWIDESGKEATDFQSSEAQYLKSSKELSEGAKSKATTVESQP